MEEDQRMVTLKFMGHELHLYLSAAAQFEIDELTDAWNAGHVDGATLTDILTGIGPERGEFLAQVAGILSEAGAAARKYVGRERGDALGGDAIARLLPVITPKDWLQLREAVTRAMAEGYGTGGEQAAEEEIDLGLQEIERQERAAGKKRRPGRRCSGWLRSRA
jgi:hypothetical protein